jgi:tetratricopeptide (TPR) repeat protein
MLIRVVGALLISFLVMAQTEPDPQALYKAGFDARVAQNYDAAIRLLTEAIATGKLNKNDLATSYNNRGMAFAATDQPDKAIADYNVAIEIAPAYGPAYLNRGNVYYQQDKYDQAIADFNIALTISPNYALAYNSRGGVHYSKGAYDAAIADFTSAIRYKPDYGNAYWNRGRSYSNKGSFQQALADFDEAIRFKPKESRIYVDRAMVWMALKDEAGAIADYTAAVEIDPKDAKLFNTRGDSYFTMGQIEKAVADYATASRLAPTYPDPFTSRGRIELFHINRPAAAAADLATGVRLDPKDIYATIWLHIARSRAGTPDRDELAANAARLGPGDWPYPLLELFLGGMTPEAVRKAAADAENEDKRREQICEADFYLGVFSLEKKARDEARKLIASAAENCPPSMLEKPAAKAELARLSP